MIKVVLADDHLMVREGLKRLIELDDEIEVVGQASNGEEALKLVNELDADILLLDINMPIMNGLETLKELKKKKNKIKVLMLTIHNEVEYLYKAVELNAEGYVLKDSKADILIAAIKSIYKGETYIQPNMTSLLFKKMNEGTQEKININKLTKRELEVLKLLTGGMLNKEIATKLKISEKTVKNHISNIFKKIQVSDRTQAAVYAIRNNIVNINKQSFH